MSRAREGCSLRTDTAATVSETKTLRVVAVEGTGHSELNPNQREQAPCRRKTMKNLMTTLALQRNPVEAFRDDPLADTRQLISQEVPPGVDRRNFLIRSAVGGAAAVMTGRLVSAEERTAMAIATLPPQAKALRESRCPSLPT